MKENEMALENDFVTPQHPLPKEIQEMKRDETVCQFCGVSYLIHNEIKKLEDEVVKLKKELERCKDFDKREAELKLKLKEENERYAKSQEELREAKIKNGVLTEQINDLNNSKKDLKSERDSFKNELDKHLDEISNMKCKYRQLYSSLADMTKVMSWLKGENTLLVKNVNELRVELENGALSSSKLLTLIKDQHHSAMTNTLTDYEKLSTKFVAAEKNLKNMENKVIELEEKGKDKKELESILELKSKEIEALKYGVAKMSTEKDSISSAVDKMKAILSEKNHKLNELESSLVVAEKALQKAHETEKKQQEERKKEKEDLFAKIKELEKEMKSLKVSQKEEKETVSTTTIQLKVLKECLDKSKIEVSLLKKEREDMIEAHQNRIKQLRDSFNQKMLEADTWPKKLQEKLEEQQRKLMEEKNDLWKELTVTFQKEMENLKNVNEKEKQDVENREKLHTKKIRDQLETLQRRSKEELDNLRAKLSREKEKHDRINQSQELLIQNLELKISDLERRLSGLQQRPAEEDPSYKQKYIDTKRALDYLKEDFHRIEKNLSNKNQEMEVLQDTVRRECEERFELTEALSEARIQLLALQKRPSLTKLNSSISVPSPPSTSSDRCVKDKNLRTERVESTEHRINSTQCSVTQDTGVTFESSRTIDDEEKSRKRIAEAVAKQRASSRASFDRF